MTRQHFGIVLVISGTALLAFAVNVRSSGERIDPSAARVTQFTSSGAASSRRRRQSATIRPWLQWGGLGLLALGSALQCAEVTGLGGTFEPAQVASELSTLRERLSTHVRKYNDVF